MLHVTRLVQGEEVNIYSPVDTEELEASALWEDFLFNSIDQVLGVDVETVAYDNEDNPGQFSDDFKVRLLQLGTRTEAWVLPAEVATDVIFEVFANPNRRFVTHSTYDAKSLFTDFGLALSSRMYDTLVMAKVLDPDDLSAHDLKNLSSRFIDKGLVDSESVMYKKFREIYPDDTKRAVAKKKLAAYGFSNIPVTDVDFATYAGLDTIYCRRLFDYFLPQFDDFPGLFDREHWLNIQATDATIRGIRLDKEYTEELKTDADFTTSGANAEVKQVTGFNASQGRRLSEWFLEKGCSFDKLTKGGAPSLSNSRGHLDYQIAREENAEALEVLKLLKTVAENKNTLTTTTSLLHLVDSNGKVHPEIKTLQAKTSRMSITKPALQTIKKNRDKEDSPMRKCFLADEGCTLIGADFEQVELRVAAALSGEDKLIDAIHSGRDLHNYTAELMFGKGYNDAQRQICKTINFGVLYGAGAATVVTQTRITEDQAREAIKLWRETYPKLTAALRYWGTLDSVQTPSARVIPADEGRGYANGNYMIQSTARELLVHALYRFIEVKGWRGRLFLPIHDEIIAMSPLDMAEEMRVDLEWSMCFDFMGVPIAAEAEVLGPRWGVSAK